MNENNLRKSFQNVKKDINEIKSQLSILVNSIPQKDSVTNSKKIFTSKPSVTESMLNAVKEVFSSGIFSSGAKVKEFEKLFSEFVGSKYAIAVANGTVAIELALISLDIKKGDEIIVPSFTTIPTIEPILRIGAKPVFVDIDKETYTLDADKIEKAITKKTKAIIPVHIYGHPAELNTILKICKKNNLFLIEDCAQAHNALYDGKHVGTFGNVGCFSFYPTKNLTVLGEGGMVVTDDDKIAEKIRMLANHGEKIGERYNHVIPGGNYRLSEIHCAIGIEQLKLLPAFTERRRIIAQLYNELLKDTSIKLPSEADYARHCFHLYVIRVDKDKRDQIITKLKETNIFCGIHYPLPCHKQKAVTDLYPTPKLPNTENFAKEIISLPIYPELTDEEVKFISKSLIEVL